MNYIGKWTDYEYQSSYYPSFPCGAAYVMSHQVAQWLITNAENLYIYQVKKCFGKQAHMSNC